MLIVSRFQGESIVITCPNGEEIVVVVTKTARTKVRLGVDAPQSYHIRREEIDDAA